MATIKSVMKAKQIKQPTQVLSCRVTRQQLAAFEIKCIENGIPMSKVLQQAVTSYLKN